MTLQELRVTLALTQGEVAAACKVSKTTVSAWERGTATPRLTHLRALAKTLGVSIAEIRQAIAATAPRTPAALSDGYPASSSHEATQTAPAQVS
jgi:transcriptional regulator with XRE-family HTH domain